MNKNTPLIDQFLPFVSSRKRSHRSVIHEQQQGKQRGLVGGEEETYFQEKYRHHSIDVPSSSFRRGKSERKERNFKIGKREGSVSNTRDLMLLLWRGERRRKCILPSFKMTGNGGRGASNFGSRNFQQLSWKFSYYANLPRTDPTVDGIINRNISG